jgi:hypothetical protein
VPGPPRRMVLCSAGGEGEGYPQAQPQPSDATTAHYRFSFPRLNCNHLNYSRSNIACKDITSMFEKSSFMRGKKRSISPLPRPNT